MRATFLAAALACLAAGAADAQNRIVVVNGARFEQGFPLAPGVYAQAFGDFVGVSTATASTVPLPTELGGISVLVGTTRAPLYAVTSQAVAFVVPFSVEPGRVRVRVQRAGADIGAGDVDIFQVSPGIFFDGASPVRQGGVLNQAGQYAVDGAPARRGQVIQIFATGQGSVNPTVPDGAVPPAGSLANARGVTKVYISVDEAQVLFSGLSPQFPGLWQINAVVPDKPYITGQVPLVVTIDGLPSNQVSFRVAE